MDYYAKWDFADGLILARNACGVAVLGMDEKGDTAHQIDREAFAVKIREWAQRDHAVCAKDETRLRRFVAGAMYYLDCRDQEQRDRQNGCIVAHIEESTGGCHAY